MITLLLYHRHGCHLCEEMQDELRQLQKNGWHFQFTVIDVDADDELLHKYNNKVPLLEADGVELCRYHLDSSKLAKKSS